MKHLQDYEANRTHAARIAQQIVAYRQREPKHRSTSWGTPRAAGSRSGGGGTARGNHLRNIVLVQSAVVRSTTWTRTCGAWTATWSTSTRRWTGSCWAGARTPSARSIARTRSPRCKIGFDLPRAAADETLRAKVVQHGGRGT